MKPTPSPVRYEVRYLIGTPIVVKTFDTFRAAAKYALECLVDFDLILTVFQVGAGPGQKVWCSAEGVEVFDRPTVPNCPAAKRVLDLMYECEGEGQ